jgi:hypothetical protein
MITAQDVRVGNWLKSHLTGEYVKVDWLVIKHLLDGNIQSVYQPSIPVYEPVVLTPEILERAGFKKCSCGGWKGAIHISKNGLNELYYKGAALKHLHHLQNLIFALCGTELDINL